ncbi:hypothetical protein [Candidatus Sororendozoicomonas aggregata]|uniref:hypothetical protein n=1 Tax=Candidatus Sororendozoicomonas aggregata TaxID=3073239 RepID=UPI002ED4BF2A
MKKPKACGRTFRLESRYKIHNTSLVAGAGSWALPEGSRGRRLFSGFVFRGDTRGPEVIFKEGFVPLYQLRADQDVDLFMDRMTGNIGQGYTYGCGVSTAISARIAGYYVQHNNPCPYEAQCAVMDRSHWLSNWFQMTFEVGPLFAPYTYSGFVYLIDARLMSGYAIPVPERYRDKLLVNIDWRNAEMLKEIYEVNFMHAIPDTAIVGAVWSDKHVTDDECKKSLDWLEYKNLELTLGENPEYDGDAASVAKLFE